MRIRSWRSWSERRARWTKSSRALALNCRRGRCRGNGCLWIRWARMSVGKFHARIGAKNLLAGRCDFALKNNALADGGADAGLNEAGHASGDFGVELNCFTGHNCAENFY